MSTFPCGCVLPQGPFCDAHRLEFFGGEPVTDVDRFLMLLRDNPTLLLAAPADTSGAAMERRRQDEVHACLRCGERARTATIAGTSLGSRWLDLCMACYSWMIRGATPAPLWPGR